MGNERGKPMLHVGGVHEATIVAAPPEDPVAAPELVTVTEPGCEELQVRGAPVIVVPRLSVTVGVIVIELLPLFVTARAIDWTGQVVKVAGTLLAAPMLAKIGVVPGVMAVTRACPSSSPGAVTVVVSVATPRFTGCHVNTPTVEVISAPRLYALA
jgi:hypothetical protein